MAHLTEAYEHVIDFCVKLFRQPGLQIEPIRSVSSIELEQEGQKIHSPGLLWCLRRRLVPAKSVRDAVDVNVDTDSNITAPNK